MICPWRTYLENVSHEQRVMCETIHSFIGLYVGQTVFRWVKQRSCACLSRCCCFHGNSSCSKINPCTLQGCNVARQHIQDNGEVLNADLKVRGCWSYIRVDLPPVSLSVAWSCHLLHPVNLCIVSIKLDQMKRDKGLCKPTLSPFSWSNKGIKRAFISRGLKRFISFWSIFTMDQSQDLEPTLH